jgi:hypothetical protein
MHQQTSRSHWAAQLMQFVVHNICITPTQAQQELLTGMQQVAQEQRLAANPAGSPLPYLL